MVLSGRRLFMYYLYFLYCLDVFSSLLQQLRGGHFALQTLVLELLPVAT